MSIVKPIAKFIQQRAFSIPSGMSARAQEWRVRNVAQRNIPPAPLPVQNRQNDDDVDKEPRQITYCRVPQSTDKDQNPDTGKSDVSHSNTRTEDSDTASSSVAFGPVFPATVSESDADDSASNAGTEDSNTAHPPVAAGPVVPATVSESDTDESVSNASIEDSDTTSSSVSSAVVPVVPSTNFKVYSSIIHWNGRSYTISESLPDSTTQEAWNAMVAGYLDILEEHPQHAGVSLLKLKLDQTSKQMIIEIPSSSTKIAIEQDKNPVVKALLDFREKGNLNEFQAVLTLRSSSPREIENLNAGSVTPSNTAVQPASIDPLSTMTKPLPNLGNTCFIASVCQSWLIHQKAALEKKLNSANDDEKQVIQVFLQWIEDYKTKNPVTIRPILDLLKKHNPSWFKDPKNPSELRQQDAHELMSWMSQFMVHEAVLIQSKYSFDVEPKVQIIDQDSSPRREPPNISLSLNSQSPTTLSVLVKNYFNPEVDDDFFMPVVIMTDSAPERRALRVISQNDHFVTPPQELNFQIKRFNQGAKLNTEVEVNEILELEKQKYQLDSFIVHVGDTKDSGHYVAYVRKTNPHDGKDYFFLANDGLITPVDMSQVLTAAKQAYLLRYKKMN